VADDDPSDAPESEQPITLSDDPTLVTLTSMLPLEAELARAKLQAEEIPCFIDGAAFAATYSFVAPQVRVVVRRDDLERAAEVLARPAQHVADDEYVDERWRCPGCHRKTLEFLPRPPGRRLLRNAWFVLLFLPIILTILNRFDVPIPQFNPDKYVCVWFSITTIVGGYLLLAKRPKRCTTCGWSDAAKA
jgi:hypothetical protein